MPKNVLIVATSCAAWPGDTNEGKPTGYWLDEVAHPFLKLKEAGHEVDVVSINGGKAPLDPGSAKFEGDNGKFWNDLGGEKIMSETGKLGDVDASKYQAVLFAGGHGTCFDFPGNPDVQRVAREVYESDGVVGAVCHGPTALTDIPLSDGKQLIAGKNVTGFSNSEEEAVGLTAKVPFILCDKLAEQGAKVENVADWQSKAVVDGRLVTGQNPQSSHAVGDELVDLLASI